MATTAGWTDAASAAEGFPSGSARTTAPVMSPFVTGFATASTAGVWPNDSRRATAVKTHANGDSTGAAGASPANGFTNAFTTSDIAAVTTSTESCGAGAVDTAGCGPSAGRLTAAASGITDGAGALGVGEVSATTSGSSTASMDAVVCERTAGVLCVGSAVRVNSTSGRAVLPDGWESLDRFVSNGWCHVARAGLVDAEIR